jgi:hypothetical protein
MAKNIEYSNQVPIWKFIFLSVITFGLYEVYWMYKQWKFFKNRNELKVRPLWRSIFGPFFIHSLFVKVSKFAEDIAYDKKFGENSASLLALLYVVLVFLQRLPDPLWLISMFTFLAFIEPVRVMNFYWAKSQPDLPLKLFRWWEILLIIPLALFAIIAIIIMIIGPFLPDI